MRSNQPQGESPFPRLQSERVIQKNKDTPRSPLENHLQTHFNDPSINVEESRLWQLTFKDSFHLTSDDILEKLVYSKNSNNGLLANPILQKAQIVS